VHFRPEPVRPARRLVLGRHPKPANARRRRTDRRSGAPDVDAGWETWVCRRDRKRLGQREARADPGTWPPRLGAAAHRGGDGRAPRDGERVPVGRGDPDPAAAEVGESTPKAARETSTEAQRAVHLLDLLLHAGGAVAVPFKVQSVLENEKARLAPELLALATSRGFRDLGYGSLDAYARERLGIAPSRAKALLTIERAGEVSPALRAGWPEGRLALHGAGLHEPPGPARPPPARPVGGRRRRAGEPDHAVRRAPPARGAPGRGAHRRPRARGPALRGAARGTLAGGGCPPIPVIRHGTSRVECWAGTQSAAGARRVAAVPPDPNPASVGAFQIAVSGWKAFQANQYASVTFTSSGASHSNTPSSEL